MRSCGEHYKRLIKKVESRGLWMRFAHELSEGFPEILGEGAHTVTEEMEKRAIEISEELLYGK